MKSILYFEYENKSYAECSDRYMKSETMKSNYFSFILFLLLVSCSNSKVNSSEESKNEVIKEHNYKDVVESDESGITNSKSERYDNEHRWRQDLDSTKTESFVIIDNDTINKTDQNGMLQGEWERLFPDGTFKCSGIYKDGYKMGYWERKFPNGNWRYQVNMNNGYQHGYCKHYYENGNLKIEGGYNTGKKEGIITTYYENGKTLSKEMFKDGNYNGICKYYNESGVLLRKGNRINDDRKGNWDFYSEKGVLITSIEY